MDEPVTDQQLISPLQPQAPLIIQPKTIFPIKWIIIGIILLFGVGIGAFWVGRKTTPVLPFVSPTVSVWKPSPTLTFSPTAIPTQPINRCSSNSQCNTPCETCENKVCKKVIGCDHVIIKPSSRQTDYLNWPIKNTCFPGPENPTWEIFKTLGDKTFIYRNNQTGEMFRGTENGCE